MRKVKIMMSSAKMNERMGLIARSFSARRILVAHAALTPRRLPARDERRARAPSVGIIEQPAVPVGTIHRSWIREVRKKKKKKRSEHTQIEKETARGRARILRSIFSRPHLRTFLSPTGNPSGRQHRAAWRSSSSSPSCCSSS